MAYPKLDRTREIHALMRFDYEPDAKLSQTEYQLAFAAATFTWLYMDRQHAQALADDLNPSTEVLK